MCAVPRLLNVRATIAELKDAEKVLAREVAESMGAGVTEIIVQDIADQGNVIIAWRRKDDEYAPADISLKKLPLVRLRG